jgi:hypothetical protein
VLSFLPGHERAHTSAGPRVRHPVKDTRRPRHGQNDGVAPRSGSELFLVDPNEFVARRDQLARELRSRGDKDGAAEVKRLRRPPVAVWALNQVAHENAEVAKRLVETARDAEAAQRALLEGHPGDDFRAVVSRRRDALTAVAAAAAEVIARSGRSPDTTARDVDETLNAIVATSAALEAFARAELDAVPESSGDSEMFAGVTPPPSPTARTAPRKPGAPRTLRAVPEPEPVERPPSARLVKAREQLAAHRAAVAEAEDELGRAEAALEEADERLAVAQREQRRRTTERARVQTELERARERVARSEELVARYES